MKIIQITDLHINKEGEDTQGVNVRQNFVTILEHIKVLKPDHLVVTGDLCFDEGNIEVYQWIKKYLDDLLIPYDIIAGNHDDSVLMASVFQRESDLQNGLLFYKKELNGTTCFFLDTAKGFIAESQLDWLKEELKEVKEQYVIFMHYPPVYANVPYLEKGHELTNKAAFQKIILASGLPTTIFCGHFHVEKTIHFKNMLTYITPSCYFQIDWRTNIFKIDHYKIGFRAIEVAENSILSTLTYLEGNKY